MTASYYDSTNERTAFEVVVDGDRCGFEGASFDALLTLLLLLKWVDGTVVRNDGICADSQRKRTELQTFLAHVRACSARPPDRSCVDHDRKILAGNSHPPACETAAGGENPANVDWGEGAWVDQRVEDGLILMSQEVDVWVRLVQVGVVLDLQLDNL